MVEAFSRAACEKIIMMLLKEVVRVYKIYNPKGDYLDICFLEHSIMFSNRFYGEDSEKPIRMHQIIKESKENNE